jgi:DNA-binding NarL/FixJ family response regulator
VLEFGGDLELRAVGTPEAAEQELPGFAPDVVLIDLHLGRWHGRDLLPRLRGSRGTVILTTTDDPQEALRCCAAGAQGFWIKPLYFADFAGLIARLRTLAVAPPAGHAEDQ